MSNGKLVLTLPNGETRNFHGELFGYEQNVSGEVVFQTGHGGYVESLTDPSYQDQLLMFTYPLIGNYGVPNTNTLDRHGLEINAESNSISAAAVIVGEYIDTPSHHQSIQNLGEWLISHKCVGLTGVDTRAIVEIVREHGTLHGSIVSEYKRPERTPLVPLMKAPRYINSTDFPIATVLIIDGGIKNNQLRELLHRKLNLIVVNCKDETSLYDKIKEVDAIFVSNGPNDPEDYTTAINFLSYVMKSSPSIPIFGICLGHQLMALAAGLKTCKLKYGNRGHNIPCKLVGTSRTYITSQNHGYAVIPPQDDSEIKELFLNLNDNSNEGLYWTSHPWFTVQFHPEAKAGPTDTLALFDVFVDLITHPTRQSFESVKTLLHATHNLPLAKTYKKVLVLGSGGLSIGQSGEFDYSGSQAIKAYRESGLTTIVVNPNIATVQTSPDFVDKVYYVPITSQYVKQVIELERPDCIALSFGGQVALKCGSDLYYDGTLKKYSVDVLGTPVETITLTEDRSLFKCHVESIGEPICASKCSSSIAAAIQDAAQIGYPVLVRAAFTLGGLGSGFANNEQELRELLALSFAVSSQVIIDKSFRGWKELEYEVMRDRFGNIITVCNMENLDPLGVHTGESIVVAPSQTLTDKDHNMLRTVALKTVTSLGVIGECNIQFALNPNNSDEYYIIEVNARLSRSSALASKATGYPLAYVAAKISLGLALDTLVNNVTRTTSACFEPSMDYCVVKVPRWDLVKFDRVDQHIGSAMKSVGEGMAIGRSFEEALQSALRMTGMNELGLCGGAIPLAQCSDEELSNPSYRRILAVATRILEADSKDENYADFISHKSGSASRSGYTNFLTIKGVEHGAGVIDEINRLTGIDKWFLSAIQRITRHQLLLTTRAAACESSDVLRAKQLGFSDKFIAWCIGSTENAVRDLRHIYNIRPEIKKIDTVAAEFPCITNYLYSTYACPLTRNIPAKNTAYIEDNNTVIVLGSGVYKIGSSVEFDWCAVSCLRELRNLGKRTIMINCNPETVSTDYDEADILYFAEVSLESVLDIYSMEQPSGGVVVSVGGQLPNNIAMDLWHHQVMVVGTQPENIDGAENRYKFSRTLDRLGVDQPRWKELSSIETATTWCSEVGYPVLVRPSYVLSGAAMNVAYSDEQLLRYLSVATEVSRDHPVVISKFIAGAKEIEVDAVANKGIVCTMAICEHVENAGVHSGDATLIFPAQDLTSGTLSQITSSVNAIASELQINGPFNLQFIAKDDNVLVIECNLRVSRSFPFVSKTLGVNFVGQATKVMMRQPVTDWNVDTCCSRIGVKVPQFSFHRLPDADILLGVDMRSTGEVASFGISAAEAYLKGLTASGVEPPVRGSNILLAIGGYEAKKEFRASVLKLNELGYKIFATHNTADYITGTGGNVNELDTPTIMEWIANKKFGLIINVTERNKMRSIEELRGSAGYRMRRAAVDVGIPVLTDIKVAKLLVVGLCENSLPLLVKTNIDCFTNYKTIKLPGLVDVHVHVREPGETHKEDWASATRAALAGGITMICAMPNTTPALTTLETFNITNELARKKAVCDYALIAGACDANTSTVATDIPNAIALKMYLNNTHNHSVLAMSDTNVWLDQMTRWKAANPDRPVCVHAEGETLAAALYVAEIAKCKIHVCHVSTRADIELIKIAKKRSPELVTCEVTPHHLFRFFLPQSEADDDDDAWGYNRRNETLSVKPPLGEHADMKALWDNLDIIDCFATDHAPHLLQEKTSKCCPGFPGLETALPLLLEAVNAGKLTIDDIVLRFHTNPIRIFNLPEQPDTYIEVDMNKGHVIGRPKFSKCGWSPFEKQWARGVVKRVVIRGETAYVADHPTDKIIDGKILLENGYGKLMVPTKRTLTIPQHPIERPQLLPTTKPLTNNLSFINQHFITVECLTKDDLRIIFTVADELRKTPDCSDQLRGRTLALFFLEASTRTRVSFEAAMKRLGGDVIYVSATESSVQKGETLEDSVRCLSGVSDAVVIRHPSNGAAIKARDALLPGVHALGGTQIINAGDGTNEHPTQTLVDLYTIRQELGTLGGLCIVIVGDLKNGRTVHSLVKALALRKDIVLHYVSPDGLSIPEEIWSYVRIRGVEQHIHTELSDEIISIADVLYMTRLQTERFTEDEMRHSKVYSAEYCITPKMLAKAKPGMRVLHPLPRGPEISTGIDSDPRAAYFRQMHNAIFVRMALLKLMLIHLQRA